MKFSRRFSWSILWIAGLALASPVTQALGAAEKSAPVTVLYAGSLGGLMEKSVGPEFEKSSGYPFQGEGNGSVAAARMIKDGLRTPDAFISADAAVNSKILMGAENRNLVDWYATFASSGLVLGYNPKSRFKDLFDQSKAGKLPWYEVVAKPGFRFGRTDPNLDPKGYRTLFLFELAERHYARPGLAALLGDPANPAQIFPEPELLVRLESGQLDAAVFYRHEVIAHALPFLELPDEINQSNPRFAALYADRSFTNGKGVTTSGVAIVFTITIPSTSRNVPGAVAFLRFILSGPGGEIIGRSGLRPIPLKWEGDISKVAADLRPLLSEGKKD
ncbi:MAG: extracellular solute-binding protein [Acidobacteriota bacterium]|nr:extracellular solute-binding protein [Acidobacteriota bacterium]